MTTTTDERLIVIVTGGRDYAGAELTAELDRLGSRIVYLLCGDARGADANCVRRATDAGIEVRQVAVTEAKP